MGGAATIGRSSAGGWCRGWIRRPGNLYTVSELASLPSAAEEYIVADGIMTRGSKLLIYGSAGYGKTTLLHDLVGALVTERPWLGQYAIDRPRTVLVIQGELSLPEMSSHARALVEAGVDTDRLKFARMTDLRLPEGEDAAAGPDPGGGR